jgi:hypothetical protein
VTGRSRRVAGDGDGDGDVDVDERGERAEGGALRIRSRCLIDARRAATPEGGGGGGSGPSGGGKGDAMDLGEPPVMEKKLVKTSAGTVDPLRAVA